MFDINYVAIIVVAIMQMIIGMLWYSKALFGKTWMRLSGMSEDKMEGMKKGMGKTYTVAFISSLVMAYVLAYFIGMLGITTVSAAVSLAFWIWIGFMATAMLGMVLWEGKPNTYYLIVVSYHLVSLVVSASILAVWA